jgi:hypothetical protein
MSTGPFADSLNQKLPTKYREWYSRGERKPPGKNMMKRREFIELLPKGSPEFRS